MFIVVGLSGAGKSTVISKIKDIDVINYGDVMFEIGKDKYGVKSRDDLRKLKRETFIKIQNDAAKLISARADKKTIIDTHAVVFTIDGYIPGLPYRIIKEFNDVSHIILITAPYDEIIKRCNKDKNAGIRERKILSKKEFDKHSEITFNLVAAYSFFTGAHVVIIENKEGKLNETVEKLKNVIKS